MTYTSRTSLILAAVLSLSFAPMAASPTNPTPPVITPASPADDPEEEETSEVTEADEEEDSDAAAPHETVTEEIAEDDNSAERENEVVIAPDDNDIDIPVPSFINQKANVINLNGADWSNLRRAVNAHKIRPLSILNIGDSHIQANMGTGVTRELLQYKYGNAGRGIITPLRMSGTNQPYDYTFSSSLPYTAVKLMKAPWKRTMGFTGTSITPSTSLSNITIGTRTEEDYNPFNAITLFHKGKMVISGVTDEMGNKIAFTQHPSRDFTYLKLASPQTRVTISYENLGDLTLFGANLSGGRPGVFYHSIGNNGATYDTYNRIGDMGASIKPLNPNLVILSLGTNEAFGRLDTARLRNSIDKLVKDIRESNPTAEIVLVTPMECYRSTTKTVTKKIPVKSKKPKGKKRRVTRYKTVKTKVRSSGVNTNIRPIRDAIVAYGAENGIPVYDFWEVAGGSGAASTWVKNGLFSPDRVHHSAKGYKLEGRLMYDALVKAFGN